MITTNKVQFRAGEDLAAWLTSRAERFTASADMQARTELDLWRTVLDVELRMCLAPHLTTTTANAIAAAVGTDMLTPRIPTSSINELYVAVHDFFSGRSELSEFGLDSDSLSELLDWLEELTPTQVMALADVISRWWAADEAGDKVGWAKVGLDLREAKA